MTLNDFITNSRSAHKVMRADREKSTLSAEKSKNVVERRLLSEPAEEKDFSFVGHGTLEKSEAGLKLTCPNTLAEFPVRRAIGPRGRGTAPQKEPNYGRSTLNYSADGEDWSGYDRISLSVHPDCRGYQSVWLELTLVSGENETNYRVNLINGRWNTVVWAFGETERREVSRFSISYLLQGAQMNMADHAVFCFNQLALEKVEPTAAMPAKVELTSETLKELVWKTLNFYYSQRCGCDIPTVHLPCHEDCFCQHPDGRRAPIGGGWHSEGFMHSLTATARSAIALLKIAEKVQDDEPLYLRLMEEARVGLEWMLRTRFADGYRAVHAPIDIYTKGIIGDADDLSFPAHNDAYENFLSAEAEAMAAISYASLDQTFAGYAGRCAEADFTFAYERMHQKSSLSESDGRSDADFYFQAAKTADALYALTEQESYRARASAWADRCGADEQASAKDRLKALLGENPDGISKIVGVGERWIAPFSYFGNDIVGATEIPSIANSAALLEAVAELI